MKNKRIDMKSDEKKLLFFERSDEMMIQLFETALYGLTAPPVSHRAQLLDHFYWKIWVQSPDL